MIVSSACRAVYGAKHYASDQGTSSGWETVPSPQTLGSTGTDKTQSQLHVVRFGNRFAQRRRFRAGCGCLYPQADPRTFATPASMDPDPSKLTYRYAGPDFYLTDVDCDVIKKLLV